MDAFSDNLFLSDNFSFSEMSDLESPSDNEVEGNCNQNARTKRSDESSGATTPQEKGTRGLGLERACSSTHLNLPKY